VGETFSGSISAIVPFGLFAVLDDLYVEGLVHVSELGSEYFQFNEATHELRGERTGIRYRLGDRLTVQVARVDLEARRVDFRIVRPGEQRSADAPPGRGARAGTGEGVEERRQRQAKRAERISARRGGAAPSAAPKGAAKASGGRRRKS
jgi:ribonuclease R